jgi:hypothetical protein
MKASGDGLGMKTFVLRRCQQLRNVFHYECHRLGFIKGTEVLTPQGASLEPNSITVKQTEALTRWSPDDDVDFGERLDVLNRSGEDVISAEVCTVGGGGIAIRLDCERGPEQARVDEPARHSTAPGEEVDQTELHRSHGSCAIGPNDPCTRSRVRAGRVDEAAS